MKKFLIIIPLVCFTIFLCACINPGLKQNASMSNPWVECNQDLNKAKNIAGFSFPLELENFKVRATKNIIDIIYPIDKKRTVTIRKSFEFGRKANTHGLLDISDDYNNYPINEDVELYDCVWINLRRDNEKIYVANFSAESGIYCISCSQGLTIDEIKQIFKIIEKGETKYLFKNYKF